MEETITIPVREYEMLKSTVHALQEQLEWCKRQIFGQKSERLVDVPGKIPDLPEFEMPEA